MPTDAFNPAARAPRLAVLIDGENASARIAEALFTEIATLGEASARRIYGDAASPALRGWIDVLPRWAIQWQQNFQNTKGKNSGDIALVIDAMDLLHSGRFDGFCLVSSDSDFTRLAARIREQGVPVYGFGERKTPEPFVNACSTFLFLDEKDLDEKFPDEKLPGEKPAEGDDSAAATPASPRRPMPTAKLRQDTKLVALLREAVASEREDDGWSSLAAVGQFIGNRASFDQRNYGYAKLSSLIEASGFFELRRDGQQVFVRVKPGKG